MIVDLDGTLDDALGQMHVDIGVVDDAIGHERIEHALQVAHGAVGGLGDVLDDHGWNLQAVATALGIEDIDAQLHIGLLQLGNETAGETGEQAVLHASEVHGRTVAGQDDLLAQTEQVVEDVEEGVEGLRRTDPLLDIVDDEHVDRLKEVDEVVGGVLTHGVGELHLEEAGRHIEHALLGIEFLSAHADGIDQMGLAPAGRAEDEEGLEGRLARMLGDGEAHRARQLVGVALDEALEGLLRVELGVQVLRHGGIEHRGGLVAAGGLARSLHIVGTLALHLLILLVLAVDDQPIGQADIGLETIGECPSHKTNVVLLQVLVDVRAWNLHQHCLLLLVVGLEDNGLEPRFIYLLCDVLPDEMEAVVPKRLMTLLHRGRYFI